MCFFYPGLQMKSISAFVCLEYTVFHIVHPGRLYVYPICNLWLYLYLETPLVWLWKWTLISKSTRRLRAILLQGHTHVLFCICFMSSYNLAHHYMSTSLRQCVEWRFQTHCIKVKVKGGQRSHEQNLCPLHISRAPGLVLIIFLTCQPHWDNV